MNILIFGKDGQVGSALMNHAVGSGVAVHGLAHTDIDVTDEKALQSIVFRIKPDVLINATAYHQPMECEQHPDKAFAVNAAAVLSMAKVCEAQQIRFFTFSTDYVFDGKKSQPYDETDTPSPLQVYGVSKYAGEILVRQYNPSSVVIRSSGVYGGNAGSKSKHGNFVLSIRKQIIGNKTLEVSSEQIVSTTYAHDLADAVMKLIEEKNSRGIFHLVNNGVGSWSDVAEEIVRHMHSTCAIIPVDRQGVSDGIRRPLYSALANNTARKSGIVLPDWQDALGRYLKTLE